MFLHFTETDSLHILKKTFILEFVVKDGSGDPEPSLIDAALGLGCKWTSHDALSISVKVFIYHCCLALDCVFSHFQCVFFRIFLSSPFSFPSQQMAAPPRTWLCTVLSFPHHLVLLIGAFSRFSPLLSSITRLETLL